MALHRGTHRIRPQKRHLQRTGRGPARMRKDPARQPGFAEATGNVEGSQGWEVTQSKKKKKLESGRPKLRGHPGSSFTPSVFPGSSALGRAPLAGYLPSLADGGQIGPAGINWATQKVFTKPFLGEKCTKEASPGNPVSLAIPLI